MSRVVTQSAWSAISPFMLPAKLPTDRNTPWGPGVLVPVTSPASTPKIVTHGLGRKPQIVHCMVNNGGAAVEARLTWTATEQQATLTGDVAMVNAFVWML